MNSNDILSNILLSGGVKRSPRKTRRNKRGPLKKSPRKSPTKSLVRKSRRKIVGGNVDSKLDSNKLPLPFDMSPRLMQDREFSVADAVLRTPQALVDIGLSVASSLVSSKSLLKK